MSVHEVLCNDISMAVSIKCSRCKLQECNSSQGQEGKLQSFPLSTSLFLKEREDQTGSFPKQTDVNQNWVWISKFEAEWNQFGQGILFQIGPPCTEISPQIVFATPVALLVERRMLSPGPSNRVRQIFSSVQVIHIAEILLGMLVSSYQTQAGKRLRPGKMLKESKIEASVSSTGILTGRMGEGIRTSRKSSTLWWISTLLSRRI